MPHTTMSRAEYVKTRAVMLVEIFDLTEREHCTGNVYTRIANYNVSTICI